MSKGHKIEMSVDRGTEETPDYQVLGEIVGGTVPKKTARLVDGKRWGSNAAEGDEFDVENVSHGEFTVTIRYGTDTAQKALNDSLDVPNKERIKLVIPAPYGITITGEAIIKDREITSETGKLIEMTYTLQPNGDMTETVA